MKKRNITFQDLVPIIAFVVIFLFFTFMSYNSRTGTFRMLTSLNLTTIIEHTMMTIIIASGSLFVVAQGSIDMSVGVNLALSGVIGVWAAHATGIPFLFIPVALLVGLAVGVLNGVILSRFKVPSFMLTISMMIGIRGLVNYLQISIGAQTLPESLKFMESFAFRAVVFVVILVVMAYLFEFTKTGRYSRAIGENETTAKYVGVPVGKLKIAAFALSGLMAGVASVFSVATVGSTTQTMGVFMEMRVIMAIFLGGVLVTGGSSAKFYKILLGSFSIQIIINGLALLGWSDSHISQSVQGILLLLILYLSVLAGNKRKSAKALGEAETLCPEEGESPQAQ